jgi:hypothetical protein
MLHGKLTARAGGVIPGTPASLPPLDPAVGDLVGDDGLTVDDVIDMHRPGHPHLAGHMETPRPNNALNPDQWDGEA